MSEPDLHTASLLVILDRIQRGDRTAHEELLRRTQLRLERLCRKMLGGFPSLRPLEDTGDVLQNAVLRLMRSLEQLRPASTRDFFTLAGEQIRRELLDLVRHHRAACRHAHQSPVSLDGSSSEAPAEPMVLHEEQELERWQAFHDAVANLPTVEREVFGLIFYSGWPQVDVAGLLQVSERQIRRYWKAACAALQTALGNEMPAF